VAGFFACIHATPPGLPMPDGSLFLWEAHVALRRAPNVSLLYLGYTPKRRHALVDAPYRAMHDADNARPAGKGAKLMEKEDLRREIQECIEKNGPERAKEILYARLGTDPEFMAAATLHGIELIEAMRESEKTKGN